MAISIFDILKPIYTTLLFSKSKPTKNGHDEKTSQVTTSATVHECAGTGTTRPNSQGGRIMKSPVLVVANDNDTCATMSPSPSPPPLTTSSSSEKPGAVLLHRQMTSLGRFAMRSETTTNPSNITFFVALAHESGKDLDLHDFQAAWAKRVMERHERFRCHVSIQDDRFFELGNKSLEQENISKVRHPRHEKNELVELIQRKGSTPMDLTKNLWDIEISSGPLGSSGAIPPGCILDGNKKKKYDRETLAIFRIHHSLCDGVSLAVATGDVTDEATLLRARIHDEFRKRTMLRSEGKDAYVFLLTIIQSCLAMLWLVVAGVYSLMMQLSRMAVSSSPFDPILLAAIEVEGQRTVAWRNVDSMEEMKSVGKKISSKTTINDIGVAMVSYAIKRQLDEHATRKCQCEQNHSHLSIKIPKKVNITVPVHLTGGILRPGDQLGNKIGGFVSSIPLSLDLPVNVENKEQKQVDQDTDSDAATSRRRLYQISKVLQLEKKLPAPLISWHLAKLFTQFTPQWCTAWALKAFSANSVAVVSNVKGFPFNVHWLGRPVQFLCAFLPLPPGVPIGAVIQSYDGNISFGLHCDKRAVPDADKFAEWMLEEYARIKRKG